MLSKERAEKLEQIGIVWSAFDEKWQRGYRYAKSYYQRFGTLKISLDYVTDDGYRLGSWLYEQRKKISNRKLSEERIRLLQAIGIE